MKMTFDEMKLAVCEKLPESAVKLFHIDWLDRSKRWEYIDWAVMGLQVCHEAEKAIGDSLAEYICTLISVTAGKSHHALATYEQRLEALCRVWFPERFR